MSKDCKNSQNIEQLNIAIRVVQKELLCDGIKSAKTREEDVYNRHWGHHWMHGWILNSAKCVHCDKESYDNNQTIQ